MHGSHDLNDVCCRRHRRPIHAYRNLAQRRAAHVLAYTLQAAHMQVVLACNQGKIGNWGYGIKQGSIFLGSLPPPVGSEKGWIISEARGVAQSESNGAGLQG